MIKKLALIAIGSALIGSSASTFAADDFFGNGFVVLSINGGANTFYDLNPQTDTANPDFGGTFLGTFNPSIGDSLTLTGGEFNTFQDGGDNVSAVQLNFRVFNAGNPPFSSIAINFVSQTGNDKFWQTTNQIVNVLAGLDPGTYNFEVFGGATTSAGDRFYNNPPGFTNYVATVTVVPEPSTLTLLAGPALLGGWLFLRRRRAS